MKEYIRIQPPFKRNMGGHRELLEGQYTNEGIALLADKQWICTEKIDGINIGVNWTGHEIIIHGITHRTPIPKLLMDRLDLIFDKEEAPKIFERLFGEKDVTLYGEGYGYVIQKRGKFYLGDSVDFILFDVLDGEKWFTREDVDKVARSFGVKSVPVVMTGTLKEAINFVRTKPKSMISNRAEMEGLVCRPVVEVVDNDGNRVITKVKVKDFT